MTKLLEEAADDLQPYQFTEQELVGIEEAVAQAERGKFASDAEIATLWERFVIEEAGSTQR